MNGKFELKVRRLKDADSGTRSKLAYHAASATRSAYGFLTALNVGAVLGSGDAWKRPIIKTRGVICSQLYFESCMKIGYLLANIPPESVSPAHLSQTNLLEDIPLSWVKV